MKIWEKGVPGRGNSNSKGLAAALCLGLQNKWVTGKLKAGEGKTAGGELEGQAGAPPHRAWGRVRSWGLSPKRKEVFRKDHKQGCDMIRLMFKKDHPSWWEDKRVSGETPEEAGLVAQVGGRGGLDQGGGRADREEEGGAGLHFEVGLRGCIDLLLGWI